DDSAHANTLAAHSHAGGTHALRTLHEGDAATRLLRELSKGSLGVGAATNRRRAWEARAARGSPRELPASAEGSRPDSGGRRGRSARSMGTMTAWSVPCAWP